VSIVPTATIAEPDKPAAFVFGGVCLIGCLAAYELAIQSCAYWRVTVQALVNVSRAELAKAVGLAIPSALEEAEGFDHIAVPDNKSLVRPTSE
jgi:hypothetical protein